MTDSATVSSSPAPGPDLSPISAFADIWLQTASGMCQCAREAVIGYARLAEAGGDMLVAAAGGVAQSPDDWTSPYEQWAELCMQAAATPLRAAGLREPLLNDA